MNLAGRGQRSRKIQLIHGEPCLKKVQSDLFLEESIILDWVSGPRTPEAKAGGSLGQPVPGIKSSVFSFLFDVRSGWKHRMIPLGLLTSDFELEYQPK